MPPSGVMGLRMSMTAWVPMDDEHTMIYMLSPRPSVRTSAGQSPRPYRAEHAAQLQRLASAAFGPSPTAPTTTRSTACCSARNKGVDGYTGIVGVNLQDQAVTESMGPIYDRTNERLGSSDAMIIRVRRRMIDAARALHERGVTPPVLMSRMRTWSARAA